MVDMKRAAILTISDRGYRGERQDGSGPAVQEILDKAGFLMAHQEVLPDNQDLIEQLQHAAETLPVLSESDARSKGLIE